MGRSRWAAAVVVVALCGSGARSNAAAEPNPQDRAAARARLAEARKLYDRGDYEGALREVSTAYRLVPSPNIQFNFGQAYRGLARHVEALEAFETFLADAPGADPALRREAKQYVDELRRRVATVAISCDSDGAHISVDGRSYGLTPHAAGIRLAPGPHEIVVRKAGTPAFSQRVDLAAGTTTAVQARLAPSPPTPALAAPASGPRPRPPTALPPVALPPVVPPPSLVAPVPGPPLVGLAATPRAPASEAQPLYTRWWFWTGIGVVAAGAVVTAVALNRGGGTPGICDCTFSPGTVAIPTP